MRARITSLNNRLSAAERDAARRDRAHQEEMREVRDAAAQVHAEDVTRLNALLAAHESEVRLWVPVRACLCARVCVCGGVGSL